MEAIRSYYRLPVSLDMRDQRVLMVGGGKLAERRLRTLSETGALVTLISPEITTGIDDLLESAVVNGVGSKVSDTHIWLQWKEKKYERSDLDLVQPVLVFAATNDEKVNRSICEDALSRGIWANDVTHGQAGSFIMPSIINRGALQLTVSTSGVSPSFSALLRHKLALQYGSEYEQALDFLALMRLRFRQDVDDREERARLNRILASCPLIELVQSGQFDEWRQQVISCWDRERKLPWESERRKEG